jgi:restriction system protein
MSRSRGIVSTLVRIERNVRRAQNARARAEARAQRKVEHARRVEERYRLADAREHKRIYTESRQAEVADQNVELEHTVAALESILSEALSRNCSLDLDTLKEPLTNEPFQPGNLAHSFPVPELHDYLPPPPMWLTRLVPGAKAKHERQSIEARQRFEADMIAHAQNEIRRQQKLEAARSAHDAKVKENRRRVEEQHAEVEKLKCGVQTLNPEAVATYFTLVMDGSEYPDGFPSAFEVTYEPESKLLLVDMELPPFDIVPEVGSFKYIKTKDEITESSRSAKERRGLYASVIAQSALRTMHEVFAADSAQAVDTVAFNGYVNGIDPATGHHARPRLVSVMASPDVFSGFDLRRADPAACLHSLHAAVSKKPEDLIPVEPRFEFNVTKQPLKKTAKP